MHNKSGAWLLSRSVLSFITATSTSVSAIVNSKAGDHMKKFLSLVLVTLSPAALAINFASVMSPRDLKEIKSLTQKKTASVKVPAKKTVYVSAVKSPGRATRSNREVRTMETISTDMSSGNSAKRFLKNLNLGYYQQFLGPTLSGPSGETYNVYQEGMDTPRSGRAPLQSFHTLSLRYKISDNWAVGGSVAAVNGYTDQVENRGGVTNNGDTTFFNSRLSLFLPNVSGSFGTFFTTLSYELPTSEIARDNRQRFGWVIGETLALKLPSYKWTAGISGQIYRIYYENSQRAAVLPNGFRAMPTQLQTMIVSVSPYVNYRFNDKYQLGSTLVMDWDQRGFQESSREFNNNLPHRARVTGTYFPSMKYLSSVGVFTQALVKFRPDTTAVGAELAVNF